MNRLVLIDTLNFFHRAFHAYPPQLTTLQGEPINAVYGFASMLIGLAEELQPTHLAAAYESEKGPTFRALEFPAYKATRVPLPPEEQASFNSQIPLLEEFIRTAKIAELQAEGFEADDLIGTAAKQLTINNSQLTNRIEIIIASNDRDLMQLIGPRVRFYLPAVGRQPRRKIGAPTGASGKAKMYGEKEFFEEYGFPPSLLIDYKALRGDPSDNIPGVRGIGEKTAGELVKKYGTVKEIYRHLLDLKPAVARKLEDGKEQAELSRRLATIVTDAPVSASLQDLKFGGFTQPAVRDLFQKWNFKSLIQKIYGPPEERKENKDQIPLF